MWTNDQMLRCARLCQRLDSVFEDDAPEVALRLMVLARKHKRLCEKECNEGGYEAQIEACEKRLEALAGPENLLQFSRDPRGQTVRFTDGVGLV